VGRELATQLGARLSAFEAVFVPTFIAHGTSAPDGTSIEDLVEQARERIEALGGVEAHAVYGEPAEELAAYSASLSLLLVGSRDYGPLGRLIHGSTTHQLARSARCPLLILTRASRRAQPRRAVTEPAQTALAGS
ncbi:MAG: universal stress protein, partial [Solirubrobacterales bacterium]|nr:universal stress protein [Solirubrobacterales bacterium]